MHDQPITQRNSCRLCGSGQVRRFLSFPETPFFDEVIPRERIGQEFLAQMDVYWCADCGSVQSQHDVNVTTYYADYQYVASDSPFIRQFMEKLARETWDRFKLKEGDNVLEVGAADGYQLACFKELGARVLGFEPAENLCELARKRGVQVTTDLFTAERVQRIPDEFRPAQAFVLLHTFDHLLDPGPFLEAVKLVLDPERGVLVLEVHDLREIIRRRETSLFGHEHATFLHLQTMKRLLERHGLMLLDANFIPENQRRGNSMLIAAGLKGCALQPALDLDLEEFSWLDKWSTYEAFAVTIERSFRRLREAVREKVASGKRVAGYGAWGRGVTTLTMAGLTASDIVFVCDRNAALHGKFTPGSRIPIASPAQILEQLPDEVIVFNYGYLDEIREQLAAYTDAGGTITSVMAYLSDDSL